MKQRSEDTKSWWDRFRSLLDDQYDWPATYLFKFIVPKERVDDLRAVLGDDVPVTIRASSRGRYHSVTANIAMDSADDVISIYNAAAKVDGVVSL